MNMYLKALVIVFAGFTINHSFSAKPDTNKPDIKMYRLYNHTPHTLYAAFYYDMDKKYERPVVHQKDTVGSVFKVESNFKPVSILKIPKKSLFSSHQRNLVVSYDKSLLKPELLLVDNENFGSKNQKQYRVPDGMAEIHISDNEMRTTICMDNNKGISCILCGSAELKDSKTTSLIPSPCKQIYNNLKAAASKNYSSTRQSNTSATPSRGSFSKENN